MPRKKNVEMRENSVQYAKEKEKKNIFFLDVKVCRIKNGLNLKGRQSD